MKAFDIEMIIKAELSDTDSNCALEVETNQPLEIAASTSAVETAEFTPTAEEVCCITAVQFLEWRNFQPSGYNDECTELTREDERIVTAEDPSEGEADVTSAKTACVSLPHHLTPEQRQLLDAVLALFQPTPEKGRLNQTSKIEHVIDTGTAKPIMKKQYPFSPYVIEKVQCSRGTLSQKLNTVHGQGAD